MSGLGGPANRRERDGIEALKHVPPALQSIPASYSYYAPRAYYANERHSPVLYGTSIPCERSIFFLPKWFEFVEAKPSHALAELHGSAKRTSLLQVGNPSIRLAIRRLKKV
jgi:hypothetical protein